VEAGSLLADAAGTLNGELALGVNALVAYMPYYGFNMDDGLVVSESLARRLTSVHVETVSFPLVKGDVIDWSAPEGQRINAGSDRKPTLLARVRREFRKKQRESLAGGKTISWHAPAGLAGGLVIRVLARTDEISVDLRLERPLSEQSSVRSRGLFIFS